MLLMDIVEIVGDECEVILEIAEVIGLGTIGQIGEFQTEIRDAVTEENELESAFRTFLGLYGLQAECLVVELEAAFQIQNVEVKMIKFQLR